MTKPQPKPKPKIENKKIDLAAKREAGKRRYLRRFATRGRKKCH